MTLVRLVVPRAVGVTTHEKVLLSSPHTHTLYWQPSQFLAVNWSESASVTVTCGQKWRHADVTKNVHPSKGTVTCKTVESRSLYLPWCTWRGSWRRSLWAWTPPLGWRSRAAWGWRRRAGTPSAPCWATRRSPPRRRRTLRRPTGWWCLGRSSLRSPSRCLCTNTWGQVARRSSWRAAEFHSNLLVW